MSQPGRIYKILPDGAWRAALAAGAYEGSEVDRRDGFIHFSRAEQLAETARKHFAGQTDLILLEVEAATLGAALRDEPSRGGALFPHLYGPLPVGLVQRTWPLPWDGRAHELPTLDREAPASAQSLRN